MSAMIRLTMGDNVEVTHNQVVWKSGVFKHLNTNGTYRVLVNSTGIEEDFPYDKVKPTQQTIDRHTPIDVPLIWDDDEERDGIGFDNEDPATSGLEPD